MLALEGVGVMVADIQANAASEVGLDVFARSGRFEDPCARAPGYLVYAPVCLL